MLEHSAESFIERYCLLSQGDTVLVALSGGPDSVAMLHYLVACAQARQIDVVACHVNHMLRGSESDLDEQFCEQLCRSLGVAFETHKLDVRSEMKETALGMQQASRKGRYRILAESAERLGATKIAVAQNLDDQAETVLMRIIRGTGPEGLGGIRAYRSMNVAGREVALIRPLLSTTRDEIIDYLSRNRLDHRIDKSNEKPVYTRNRVRLKLMPELKTYNPEIEAALARLAELCHEQYELFCELAAPLSKMIENTAYGARVRTHELLALALPAQRHVVREAVKRSGGDLTTLSYAHVERVLKVARAELRTADLPGAARVVRAKSWLAFRSRFQRPARWRPLQMQVPGETRIEQLGKRITTDVLDISQVEIDPDPSKAFADLDKVRLPLSLRMRLPGDVFSPFGMKGSKKIKDFLISEAVLREDRDSIPLVVDSLGRIVWVAGFRIDERFRLDASSKRVLFMQLETLFSQS